MREEYLKKPIFNNLRKKFDLPGAQQDIHVVASRVEQGIPFANNSMDYIVALYSVPLYLQNDTERETLISEIGRILNENGKAILYPIAESHRNIFSDILGKSSLNFNFTEVPEISDVVYPNEICYRLEINK